MFAGWLPSMSVWGKKVRWWTEEAQRLNTLEPWSLERAMGDEHRFSLT